MKHEWFLNKSNKHIDETQTGVSTAIMNGNQATEMKTYCVLTEEGQTLSGM